MVHDAAASGYRRESATYAKARPSYHPDVVDRIVARYCEGRAVGELGAGTGIFTRQLVGRGVAPIAIEPVAEMRSTLEASMPDLRAVEGTAEDTGLDTASVDTVVVAQAFHWFDHGPALAEIGRVLRPGGHLVCVWNVRDETVPLMQGFTEILDRHQGDTPRYRTMEWRRAIDAAAGFDFVEEFAVANPVPSSPEGVVARALSTSFIAALGPEDQAQVVAELEELTRPLGDHFEFPYRSEFQAWRTPVGVAS